MSDQINERQVALRAEDGRLTTLKSFFDLRKIASMPFKETQVVSPSGTQFVLLNGTLLPGKIAKGVATAAVDGEIIMGALPGAVGTAATVQIANSEGQPLNLVNLRDASTHDSITDALGRKVYGLLQCASTVTDLDNIGASGSENCQMSFVTISADGSLALTAVSGTVEFQTNKVRSKRNELDMTFEGGPLEVDVISPGESRETIISFTATVAADTTLDLTQNGTGYTKSGENPVLGATSDEFNKARHVRILLNGVEQDKGIDVIWVSNTTAQIKFICDAGDKIRVLS